ncbi:MAG: hypothetical protein CMF50_01145 [Legionellales bacterium]|nr:hypothetical protein [Legionellales bacterium]
MEQAQANVGLFVEQFVSDGENAQRQLKTWLEGVYHPTVRDNLRSRTPMNIHPVTKQPVDVLTEALSASKRYFQTSLDRLKEKRAHIAQSLKEKYPAASDEQLEKLMADLSRGLDEKERAIKRELEKEHMAVDQKMLDDYENAVARAAVRNMHNVTQKAMYAAGGNAKPGVSIDGSNLPASFSETYEESDVNKQIDQYHRYWVNCKGSLLGANACSIEVNVSKNGSTRFSVPPSASQEQIIHAYKQELIRRIAMGHKQFTLTGMNATERKACYSLLRRMLGPNVYNNVTGLTEDEKSVVEREIKAEETQGESKTLKQMGLARHIPDDVQVDINNRRNEIREAEAKSDPTASAEAGMTTTTAEEAKSHGMKIK